MYNIHPQRDFGNQIYILFLIGTQVLEIELLFQAKNS